MILALFVASGVIVLPLTAFHFYYAATDRYPRPLTPCHDKSTVSLDTDSRKDHDS